MYAKEEDIMRWDIDKENPYKKNMLLVVDYVCGREELIGKLIIKLSEVRSRKVRLLLIERENRKDTGSWYSKLSSDYREQRRIENTLLSI